MSRFGGTLKNRSCTRQELKPLGIQYAVLKVNDNSDDSLFPNSIVKAVLYSCRAFELSSNLTENREPLIVRILAR